MSGIPASSRGHYMRIRLRGGPSLDEYPHDEEHSVTALDQVASEHPLTDYRLFLHSRAVILTVEHIVVCVAHPLGVSRATDHRSQAPWRMQLEVCDPASPEHLLLGLADPLATSSRNNVRYGHLELT